MAKGRRYVKAEGSQIYHIAKRCFLSYRLGNPICGAKMQFRTLWKPKVDAKHRLCKKCQKAVRGW